MKVCAVHAAKKALFYDNFRYVLFFYVYSYVYSKDLNVYKLHTLYIYTYICNICIEWGGSKNIGTTFYVIYIYTTALSGATVAAAKGYTTPVFWVRDTYIVYSTCEFFIYI